MLYGHLFRREETVQNRKQCFSKAVERIIVARLNMDDVVSLLFVDCKPAHKTSALQHNDAGNFVPAGYRVRSER